MLVIRRCECSAQIFVQCSALNTEICMECKDLRSSSHPNTFEDMKLTPYLFPNCLVPNISFFPNVKLSFYYVSSLKTSRVVVCRHAWGAYATEMQTYDHRHAWRLRQCGVMPLWCRHRAVVLHVHQYEGKAGLLRLQQIAFTM